MLKLLEDLPALYTESARVLALPYVDYKRQAQALFTSIGESRNPFVKQFFTVFKNIRGKEFSAMVRYAMLKAAAAYKSGEMAAFNRVEDPLAGGPFEITRVQFEGVDRGFRLRSKEQFRDFDEVLIFLEKPGKPLARW